jgi:Glycosyltransferase 61
VLTKARPGCRGSLSKRTDVARLPAPLRPWWPVAKRAYTAGTRAVSPATRAVSRARGGVLPVRAVETFDEAIALSGWGRLIEVGPAEVLERNVPDGDASVRTTFAQQLRLPIPRRAVAELPDGRVLGPHRAVIDGNGTLIHEVTRYFGTTRPSEHPLFLHPMAEPAHHVDGSLAVLASRGDWNYFHFLIDVLPRIATVEAAGITPDRWYVPAKTRFQRDLLALLGVTADRIVDAAEHVHVQADNLVVPTLPDLDLSAPPWLVEALRQRLLPPDVGLRPGRRVYVTRGQARNTRIVTNEAELIAALRDRGFETVDPGAISVAEQIRTFAEAEVIIAPHGAALANLTFASPGATVVELFPPDYVQGCYWKLADGVPGLTYRGYVGVGPAPRRGRMWGVASDVTVDVPRMVRIVDELLDSAGDSPRASLGTDLP